MATPNATTEDRLVAGRAGVLWGGLHPLGRAVDRLNQAATQIEADRDILERAASGGRLANNRVVVEHDEQTMRKSPTTSSPSRAGRAS